MLESSSALPHAKISAAQRKRRRLEGFDTTIQHEFNMGYKEMIEAGVDIKAAKKAIKKSYKYFDSIGGFI